jgi:hypothetical protein
LDPVRVAKPQTLVKGQAGVRLELAVGFEAGRKHMPGRHAAAHSDTFPLAHSAQARAAVSAHAAHLI